MVTRTPVASRTLRRYSLSSLASISSQPVMEGSSLAPHEESASLRQVGTAVSMVKLLMPLTLTGARQTHFRDDAIR
jgi:hypothetical protein